MQQRHKKDLDSLLPEQATAVYTAPGRVYPLQGAALKSSPLNKSGNYVLKKPWLTALRHVRHG